MLGEPASAVQSREAPTMKQMETLMEQMAQHSKELEELKDSMSHEWGSLRIEAEY